MRTLAEVLEALKAGATELYLHYNRDDYVNIDDNSVNMDVNLAHFLDIFKVLEVNTDQQHAYHSCTPLEQANTHQP